MEVCYERAIGLRVGDMGAKRRTVTRGASEEGPCCLDKWAGAQVVYVRTGGLGMAKRHSWLQAQQFPVQLSPPRVLGADRGGGRYVY